MKKYYVLKDTLVYNGKEYKRGDELNHKLGIRDQRILNMMVEQRRISVSEPESVPTPTVAPVAPPPAAPNKAVLNHVGGGYYEIVKNGVTIDKVQGKENAQKVLDEL